jgi:hypothetical protein
LATRPSGAGYGNERARFRFVFEPFIFFYLLALLDAMAAWFLRERTTCRA